MVGWWFFSLLPTTERSWASACAAPCILNSLFVFFWCGGSVCQSSRARLRSWRAQESDKESKPIILMPLFNSSRSFWDSPLSARQNWVSGACGWNGANSHFNFARTRKRKNYCSRSVNNNNLKNQIDIFPTFFDFSTLSGPFASLERAACTDLALWCVDAQVKRIRMRILRVSAHTPADTMYVVEVKLCAIFIPFIWRLHWMLCSILLLYPLSEYIVRSLFAADGERARMSIVRQWLDCTCTAFHITYTFNTPVSHSVHRFHANWWDWSRTGRNAQRRFNFEPWIKPILRSMES